MRCPVCEASLSPYSYGGQTIDVCPECRGIWFDPHELGNVAKEMIRQGIVPDQNAADAFGSRRIDADSDPITKICPRCSIPTVAFNYSYDSNVFLNKCPKCQGIWADAGEPEGLATYMKGNPAVTRYCEALLEEMHRKHAGSMASRLLKSRTLSGIVALLYVAGPVITANSEAIWGIVLFLSFPIVCIWFSDAMGRFTGILLPFRPAITRRTPGLFVALGGWIILLSPLIFAVVHSIGRALK